ncbi:ATP-binding cassette subfamily B tetracycline resistance protein [Streptococcus gallinaceus]|uniref:ABC transporter ATP-binding protein n=1 Tax=Streptococcus gallinaceus TaxID=165758 RepID=UPI00209CC77D|nr:ABC transporter ATP-binding protein [Streptococcus gallinaceus]MCP1638926.1 ATP-binding cassette subfamily B tetracycline resistance protein [Streptococcus gallinaceus]MCP1769830.1 ATP-binding cassette subfamily B tetracycline resistance protein [Streptococcus gallinaceus]
MKIIVPLVKEIKHVAVLFFWGVLLFLLATLASQVAPLLLQAVIDGPLTDLSKHMAFDEADFLERLAGYVGLIALGGGLSYLAMRILIHSANKIAENLRNRAYDVMQNLPISYFDDKPAGKIATRIVNDTETLRNQFYSMLVYIGSNVVRVVITYGIIFYMNVSLGLVLLLLIPVFYLIQLIYAKMTNAPMKDFYDARSEVNTQVNETMNGASLIQLFGQEEHILDEFEATATKMKNADNRIIWAQSIASWPLTEFIKNMVVAAILTLIGMQFLSGHAAITAGRLFIYLNYVIELFDLMGMLVRQLPNIQRSMETGQRVLNLLDAETEIDAAEELVVKDGRVRFEAVQFAYEEGKPVLQDINLEVEKGQTIALVGHTGSGKSSIMNLLYRFYDPQSGRILIDDQDISQFSRESLRSYMGIVLQDPYLFTGTITTNVAMDKTDAKDEDILAALEQVGAGDLLSRLSKGIHEPVVEKGASFSSGERQLIAFARTLFSNPKILILDEATSHIDTETEDIIQRAMEVVKAGRTTFIIAHRLSTIQNANQILVLDAGQIVERGNHEELLALGGIYAHMHKIQQKV